MLIAPGPSSTLLGSTPPRASSRHRGDSATESCTRVVGDSQRLVELHGFGGGLEVEAVVGPATEDGSEFVVGGFDSFSVAGSVFELHARSVQRFVAWQGADALGD